MQNKTLQTKRVLRTVLLVLLLGVAGTETMSAQNLYYDFEQCNVGDKIAATLGEPWTTWNWNPGSAEDAVISDEHCIGTRALKIDNGNDVVLLFGKKTSGVYHISFDMYIPEGKEAYFNLQHVFEGDDKVNAINVYFNSVQYGTMFQIPGNSFEISCDEWFNINLTVNVDDGLINLTINNTLIANYFLTETSLAAINFWPLSANENRNGFFVDNILFEEVEGPHIHNIASENEQISVVMQKDECDTISNMIVNEGNVIDRINSPWVDYGIGQEGGETKVLHYDSEPYYYYGNYNNNPYIEVGAMFYIDYLLDSVMAVGMKIKKMQYYVNGYAANGMEGPLTFRIYSKNIPTDNSSLIAEKTLYEYTYNAWNTIEFDEPIPLRGHPIFASVGFQQVNGGYPISLDAGPSLRKKADWVRLTGTDWFSLNANSIYYGGGDFGNHNIRLICEGQPVETRWVRKIFISDHYVSFDILSPGQAEIVDLSFNTSGMNNGEYEAVLRVGTPYDETSELAIPIKLKVSGTDVSEFTEDKCKVYPNPTNGNVIIEAEGLRNITISNMLGQIIYEGNASGNAFEYDFSKHKTGIYLIHIETESGVVTKKVTVER